jgi:hypothetical protein
MIHKRYHLLLIVVIRSASISHPYHPYRSICSLFLFLVLSMTTTCTATTNRPSRRLVIATRLHLGKASSPPSDEKIKEWISNFQRLTSETTVETSRDYTCIPVIAVDATPKIPGYDYVDAIRQLCPPNIYILPVTPWYQFVAALNALLLYATHDAKADCILFVSAEVSASASCIVTLLGHLKNDTLVVGAAMNGHVYHKPGETVILTGRTCPWNTLAIWNVPKLCQTGFVMVSDLGSAGGVEECAAVALQQKLFSVSDRKAKLVQLKEIYTWQETFDDEERKKWHEQKMNSKLERANKQLVALQLSGSVLHC